MGHSVWADVVPYVAHEVVVCDMFDSVTDDLVLLIAPESWAEGEHLSEEEYSVRGEIDIENLQGQECRGWTLDYRDDTYLGKKKRLFGSRWRKGELSVWLVNESAYSNIGDYSMAACANDRLSLEEFLKDWNFDKPIAELDSVMQSG